MLIFFFYFFLLLLITMFMLLLNLLLSKKVWKNREKMSPFECGFDPQSMNRLPFSLHFMLLAIIFLIFDVEISVILPMIKSYSYLYWLINFNCFLIMLILLIGLIFEWKEGALVWFKN